MGIRTAITAIDEHQRRWHPLTPGSDLQRHTHPGLRREQVPVDRPAHLDNRHRRTIPNDGEAAPVSGVDREKFVILVGSRAPVHGPLLILLGRRPRELEGLNKKK